MAVGIIYNAQNVVCHTLVGLCKRITIAGKVIVAVSL